MAHRFDLIARRGSAGQGAWAFPAALGLALAGPVAGPVHAQAVVQPIPPAALEDLNAALRELARDPRNHSALLRAGWASIDLEDADAALGYFRRAQEVAPGDGAVRAGMAAAMLRLDDPVSAVRLFGEAEASGTPLAEHAGDRGLAHDLVGDNLRAQQYYGQALARANDPEIVRRLALSQAIAGDQRASEATLLPLLQRSDLAAYRTRAFALAILGKAEEAVSIAETMLPAQISNRMAPYLRYMPRLTRAQQAAAANLGKFPRASEIGRDTPAIAAYPAGGAPQVAARGADARLVPSGEPLGATARSERSERRSSARGRRTDRERVPVARAERPSSQTPATPQPEPAQQAPASPPPAVATAETTQPLATQPAPVDQPVVVASIEKPAVTPARPAQESPRPSFSISAATPQDAGNTEAEVSLAEVFAGFSLPAETTARPAPGAVDITTITPAREAPRPQPQAKPEPPPHPSRHWVQVATGQDTAALAWDWRRIKREGGDLLAGREAHTAKWGQTNRLVTGPYRSADEAQEAVTALKAKGVDSFRFTSAAGEEVVPLK